MKQAGGGRGGAAERSGRGGGEQIVPNSEAKGDKREPPERGARQAGRRK